MKRKSLVIPACLLLFLFLGEVLSLHGADTDTVGDLPRPDHSVVRQIQYSFTLQNTTNRLIKKAEFWTYAPLKQTSTQRLVNLEVSHPFNFRTNSLGNQILHFEFIDLPPYASRIITIKANIELSDKLATIPIQDLRPFLETEKYVESTDPEISSLAKRFKDQRTVVTAENIYRWVADNLKYEGYLANDRGALYALKNRKGDCTEFMYLFTALCRANGVPSRGIGGYVCRENTILKASDYHNWAEFYDEGAWKLADPQKKVFLDDQSIYIAMNVIGEPEESSTKRFHRFRYSGEGLKVAMNK